MLTYRDRSVIDRWRSGSSTLGALGWLGLHGVGQPRFPFRDEAAIERAQRRRVAATIRYAYRYVPYYRETMDRLGLAPADIRSASDLARLPVIERSQLQTDPERLTSGLRPLERCVRLRSSGSSGAPVTVYHDPFALIRLAGYYQRLGGLLHAEAGRRFGCRTLEIGHPFRTEFQDSEETLARVSRLVGERTLSVSILDPVERNLQEINRFRPHVLSSFGSYIEKLFVHLQASGEPFHRPSVIVYDSDAISPAARKLITESFGIPVYSDYGAYEALFLGFECPAHLGYHINLDLYPLRVVDPDGRELPPGERGEVMVSDLVNRGTILLNYRLGDLASWLPGPCPCGRKLPLLSFIQGRVADWLETPSGERLHPETLAYVLDVEPGVIRYQAVQRAPSRLTVKLVPAAGASRLAIKQRVEHGFQQLLGPEIATEVRFVDDLPRTAGGKVRTVIRLDAPAVDGPALT
jgi:phenylacetate-CoA ligase